MSATTRFVAVRWYLPGMKSIVEVYDRRSESDVSAWDQNSTIGYRQQVVAYSGDRASLVSRYCSEAA